MKVKWTEYKPNDEGRAVVQETRLLLETIINRQKNFVGIRDEKGLTLANIKGGTNVGKEGGKRPSPRENLLDKIIRETEGG